MSHLEDRLAEFVFEDLPPTEMDRARHHVAQCLECQQKVQSFQKTLGLLEQVPSRDVPRRVVFVEPPSSVPQTVSAQRVIAWTRLAWALPSGVAALLVLTVLLGGGVSVEWSDGIRVAFGRPESQVGVETAIPGIANVDYGQLDYDQIANELSASVTSSYDSVFDEMRAELSRVRVELERLDGFDAVEIERLRAEIQNLYNQHQLVERDIYDQNAAVQQIASRLE